VTTNYVPEQQASLKVISENTEGYGIGEEEVQILLDRMPRVLPSKWAELPFDGLSKKYRRVDRLQVIATVDLHKDGRKWLHVSLSRHDRLPSYSDLLEVKDLFVGREHKAIQVFPQRPST